MKELAIYLRTAKQTLAPYLCKGTNPIFRDSLIGTLAHILNLPLNLTITFFQTCSIMQLHSGLQFSPQYNIREVALLASLNALWNSRFLCVSQVKRVTPPDQN